MEQNKVSQLMASLESHEQFEPSLEGINAMFARFGNRVEEAKKSFSAKIEPKVKMRDLQTTAQRLMFRPYEPMVDLKVPCPRGLAISLVDYTELFAESVDHILQSRARLIPSYSIWLASAITSPESHKTLLGRRQVNASLERETGVLTKRLGDALTPESQIQHSETTYGKLFSSNRQWSEVLKNFARVEGGLTQELHLFMMEQHKSLSERSRLASQALILSYKQGQISKQYMNDAADVLEVCAREFEFYALFRHMATELEVALDQLVKRL